MKVVNIGEHNSVLNNFVAELRDARIQKDALRFRRNLERVGEIFAYEISKVLDYSVKKVTTPLGIAEVSTCDSQLVLATILRAGLPLHQGMLNYFDKAGTAFIAAFRKHGKGDWFKVYAKYDVYRNNATDESMKTIYSIAPNFQIHKNLMFQLQYNYVDNKPTSSQWNELWAELYVRF